MAAEQMLSITEVAKLWRCSRGHVYNLIAAGRLRSTDIGDGRAKTRVPESALAECTESRMRPASVRRLRPVPSARKRSAA